MDIPHLRYFVAVVEHQSFSKAAAHCNTSTSNISEQIQKFEKRIGKMLLDRSRRRIVPTEAGEVLLRRAKEILAHIEKANEEVRSVGKRQVGKVLVGILMTIAPCFLVHVLNSFVEQFPDIQISLFETTTALILSMLDIGKLDMGITSLPVRDDVFETEVLFTEEMLLALPPSHPLTRKKVIYKEDLESEKFILSKEDHCHGGYAFRLCRPNNLSSRIVFHSGQLAMIQSLVAAGKGISLIPQTAISETSATIAYRQLGNPRPKRSIAAVTRSKRPLKPAAQRFLQHLREASQTFKLPVANNHASASSEQTKA
ncbi:MAG TPA: LysR family transcriptional regulator [Verrucomicrobiae bacterium]|nr:LysR family transcriptional regulator [Verrucomicrobiae bacterium]